MRLREDFLMSYNSANDVDVQFPTMEIFATRIPSRLAPYPSYGYRRAPQNPISY